MGINAYFIAPASVVPLLTDIYGINKATAGLAVSVPILGSVLLQIPGGFLMDRYDNRRLLFWALVGFVLTTMVGLIVTSYTTWLATRFTAGICAIFLFTMGAKVITETFPPAKQGFATTVFTASAPMGIALGQFGTPRLVNVVGFSTSFAVYAVVSTIGYSLFYSSTPTPIHSGSDVEPGVIRRVLTDRRIVLMSISAACSYSLYFFLNSWMPTYGVEILSLPINRAGAIAALVPIMGIFGRPGGGWLSDYFGTRRYVIVGAIAVTLPAFLAITSAPTLLIFALCLLLVGFVLQFAMGVYFVYVQELAEKGTGGTALAVFGAVGFSGSLVSPTVGGWLIDAFSWTTALVAYTFVGVAGIGATLLITRSN
ncbi:MFS transporter [Natronomonas sp.]|uniref:MFS transporter n=1 Tax=Natronomonas sp. TaxID=2184060 RepID=UPI003975EED1